MANDDRHERAATSQWAAAQQCTKGAHDASQRRSIDALQYAMKADGASELASEASAQNLEPAPTGSTT
jgi:hypothetical protein